MVDINFTSTMIVQYYKTIPLRLIPRNYTHFKAKRFTINGTNQNVWIPNKHLDKNGMIKAGEDIDYVFRRCYRKLELAGLNVRNLPLEISVKNVYERKVLLNADTAHQKEMV